VIWSPKLKLNVGFKSRNDCVVEESSLCYDLKDLLSEKNTF
jgi:hypothetical protein